MAQWRLAQIRPNADRIARRNLMRQGFEVFQPLERGAVIRRGKFMTQVRPFFSGYAFISHASDAAPWSLVNSTYGVSRLVKFGDRPAIVPEGLVAELMSACDEAEIIAALPSVVAGCSVEVRSGTFTGFVGEVERLAPDHRALVLLEFLGKQTRANLPIAQLKIAKLQSGTRSVGL